MAFLPSQYILATLMRIPAKVSLAVGALALLVFGPMAVWQARVERADLLRAVERELMLTGRAMRVAAENALRDRQVHDVEVAVSALESIQPDVDVVLFAPDGTVRTASEGARRSSPDPGELARLVGGPPDVDLERGRALLVVPVDVAGKRVATLAITRPLDDVANDLRREVGTLTVAVVAFTILVSACAYGLGELFVGRPLALLSAAMARVGGGGRDIPLDTTREDEIGAVTRDFEAMVTELDRARVRLEEEQDAHRRSMRALQDADRMVTIGQLSAGLAHEIGSPLQVLHGRARRLLHQIHSPEEVRRAASIIAAEAERITRIVQQLLDVARRRARHVTGDPRTAVRSVVDLLEVEARRKRVALRLVLADDVDEHVESDALQQIALNLVRNALQATSEGGHVTVTLERSTFTKPASPVATPSLRLSVEDDGPGIADAIRPHLFEPFFTTRHAEGGTGLGLAIVASLVHELGGSFDVASEPGHGSRFVVDIPLHRPASAGGAKVA